MFDRHAQEYRSLDRPDLAPLTILRPLLGKSPEYQRAAAYCIHHTCANQELNEEFTRFMETHPDIVQMIRRWRDLQVAMDSCHAALNMGPGLRLVPSGWSPSDLLGSVVKNIMRATRFDFCRVIGQRSITEFNYRYADAKEAHVFVGVELPNGDSDKTDLISSLSRQRYKVVDLSGNEMAKVHVRYMVGGRVNGVRNERLIRFEFPEHPGALLRFLTRMGQRWNISLFHYRNHGAAYGRVLAGIQVPSSDLDHFHSFLTGLGYPFHEEAHNPAYDLFLGAVH